MNIFKSLTFLLLAFVSLNVFPANTLIELNEKNFKKHKNDKGVIILQLNWGRQWKCGAYENAQLHSLIFKNIKNGVVLDFTNPSPLSSKDVYLPFTYIVSSGEYALVEFDIKVAKSTSEVGHFKATESKLTRDGKAIGGSFTVIESEAVYIGTFGIDCYKDPIPWRFYIEGREEFDNFVDGFRYTFPYLEHVPVVFRLFDTKLFGQPYSLN